MTRALAFALVLLCGSASAGPISGTARVVDGDTIALAGQRIRLAGIDAPERSQTCAGREGQTYECGRDAAAVLAELVRGRVVTCIAKDTDKYGRTIATCSTEVGDLGAAMVRRGWALDYTRYSRGAYRAEEAAAKVERLGIWKRGGFALPEEYRRERR